LRKLAKKQEAQLCIALWNHAMRKAKLDHVRKQSLALEFQKLSSPSATPTLQCLVAHKL
jgi:hypothetical protein